MSHWDPASWQSLPNPQRVDYASQDKLEKAMASLGQLPALVSSLEIQNLKTQLAEAAKGQRFILQGGDCAESFADCNDRIITNKLRILLQMSVILIHGLRKPITRIGRIAGQYAKPRSAPIETRDGITLPSYRGDIINKAAFNEEDREPDPNLMLSGYNYSATTLNFIRSLSSSGFADLNHPEFWNLDFVQYASMADEYRGIIEGIKDSISFLNVIRGYNSDELTRVEFFTSHEALHLHYEEALTRQDENGKWYDASTHLPWVGMRTAALDGAHIEYLRGINNPIGVKVGPAMSAEWLTQLVETLNPTNEPGRLMLIHRFGVDKVADLLPKAIEIVRAAGHEVMWSCDPMHGNTETTAAGIKTRKFTNILEELQQAFKIHQSMDSCLGGVHFELTGEDVTECTGGARGLTDEGLQRAYKSLVDPRLNYEQSLEMAMLIIQQ